MISSRCFGAAPTVTTYTYNAANQLTGDGTTTYTYDPNGNLTTGATWDRANRMRSFAGADYAYDGLGNRIAQTVTRYLLDLQPGLAVVLSETAGANTTRYVHSPRGIHAQKDSANNWEWMAQNGLGSVRNVVDASANLLWSTSYDPFGNGFGALGTAQSPYAFIGEPALPGGLLHLRARNYHPALGIFTALDPFEGMANRPMSLNGYSWVEGNTVNMVDPSGKIYEKPNKWSGCSTYAKALPSDTSCNPEQDSRSETGGCKIEVSGIFVARPVDILFPIIIRVEGWHAAIIFTDRTGNEFIFRSGVPLDKPQCRPKEGDLAPLDRDGFFGIICAQGEPWYQSEDRRLSDPEERAAYPRQVLLAGEEACSKLPCLYQTVDRINEAGLIYDLLNNNSNTGAYTYLVECGIPALHPIEGSYPGWGHGYTLP